jgi:hypothetical protein
MMLVEQKRLLSILDLPKHLQESMSVMLKVGIATAVHLSKYTKRARPVESSYLNQLTLLGFLDWERKGRNKYFKLK